MTFACSANFYIYFVKYSGRVFLRRRPERSQNQEIDGSLVPLGKTKHRLLNNQSSTQSRSQENIEKSGQKQLKTTYFIIKSPKPGSPLRITI